MIVNETENRNFNAVSAINVENGQATPIVYMAATYNQANGLSFSDSIQDVTLYKEHKAEADADREAFQTSVYTKIFGA